MKGRKMIKVDKFECDGITGFQSSEPGSWGVCSIAFVQVNRLGLPRVPEPIQVKKERFMLHFRNRNATPVSLTRLQSTLRKHFKFCLSSANQHQARER